MFMVKHGHLTVQDYDRADPELIDAIHRLPRAIQSVRIVR